MTAIRHPAGPAQSATEQSAPGRASRQALIASNASLLDRNGRLVGIPALPVR
jgi:hypothetical protein